MQGRYQGVDWRDKDVWECNAAENPFNYARVDGVSLAPMELMFVKVKHNMVLLNYPSALAAVAYDDWYNQTAAVRTPISCLMPQTATATRPDTASTLSQGEVSDVTAMHAGHAVGAAEPCVREAVGVPGAVHPRDGSRRA